MSYTAEKYPAYDGSTAITGKKFLLHVAYDNKRNRIGGLRDTTL